jgi:hypothetical protein
MRVVPRLSYAKTLEARQHSLLPAWQWPTWLMLGTWLVVHIYSFIRYNYYGGMCHTHRSLSVCLCMCSQSCVARNGILGLYTVLCTGSGQCAERGLPVYFREGRVAWLVVHVYSFIRYNYYGGVCVCLCVLQCWCGGGGCCLAHSCGVVPKGSTFACDSLLQCAEVFLPVSYSSHGTHSECNTYSVASTVTGSPWQSVIMWILNKSVGEFCLRVYCFFFSRGLRCVLCDEISSGTTVGALQHRLWVLCMKFPLSFSGYSPCQPLPWVCAVWPSGTSVGALQESLREHTAQCRTVIACRAVSTLSA